MARSLFLLLFLSFGVCVLFFLFFGGGGGAGAPCGYSFSLLDYLDNSFMAAVITTILGPFGGAMFPVF